MVESYLYVEIKKFLNAVLRKLFDNLCIQKDFQRLERLFRPKPK